MANDFKPQLFYDIDKRHAWNWAIMNYGPTSGCAQKQLPSLEWHFLNCDVPRRYGSKQCIAKAIRLFVSAFIYQQVKVNQCFKTKPYLKKGKNVCQSQSCKMRFQNIWWALVSNKTIRSYHMKSFLRNSISAIMLFCMHVIF